MNVADNLESERVVVHDWDWWAYQFRVVHRQGVPNIGACDDYVVAFAMEVLRLQPADRVLDLACGSGEHARRFARLGLDVVGLDVAPSLVRHCTERAACEGLSQVRFVAGDMRDLGASLEPSDLFDGIVVLSASFGFFDDETNQCVLDDIASRLDDRGRLLLQLVDPLKVAVCLGRSVHREERPEGLYVEETQFDPATFTSHTRFQFTDLEGVLHLCSQQEQLRVYTLPEIRTMLGHAGMRLVGAYGEVGLPPPPYGADCNRQLIVVGERGEDGWSG